MSSIGPQLPPHLQASTSKATSPPLQAAKRAPASAAESDSDSDDYAPALPPSLVAARSTGPAFSSAKRPRIVGPAPPPADDSDDEVGPSIALAARPGESSATGVSEFLEREARWAKEREEQNRPKEMKREEWMLVPPEQGELAQTLDPLKARSFSRVSTDPTTTRDQTLWTETPAERQQRLADEIAGKKRKADGTGPRAVDEAEEAERSRRRRRDEGIERSIREHNASHRAAPLLEQHTKSSSSKSAKAGPGADDPPPIWDRDLHMAVTGKLLDEGERRKMIKDAKGLGDRFGHGKRGAYS